MHATLFEQDFGPSVSGTVLPPLSELSAADEANHRIANHLQLVSVLLSREARAVDNDDAREALNRTHARIWAIAGVHRLLQDSSTQQLVDLQPFLERLCDQFAQSCPDHRRLILRADTVMVDARSATRIGMLVIELVTNACKFAYLVGEPGDIFVGLRRITPGRFELSVQDRGRGVASQKAHAHGTGLGQRLIDKTVRQLGGVAVWEDANPGLRFRLELKNQ